MWEAREIFVILQLAAVRYLVNLSAKIYLPFIHWGGHQNNIRIHNMNMKFLLPIEHSNVIRNRMLLKFTATDCDIESAILKILDITLFTAK